MSQHDFTIDNQSAPNARADINNALKALNSLSSGATAPATTYANMPWIESVGSDYVWSIRSGADDAWIEIGALNQGDNTFCLFEDTKVVNSGGTQVGVLGEQSASTWELGTGTTESLVSPAKVKAAIDKGKFLSSNQTITTAGSVTVAHGLGAVPSVVYIELECVTAEYGYSVGDIIDVSNVIWSNSLSSRVAGATVLKGSTDLKVIFANTGVFYAMDYTTGDDSALTNANWVMRVGAVS